MKWEGGQTEEEIRVSQQKALKSCLVRREDGKMEEKVKGMSTIGLRVLVSKQVDKQQCSRIRMSEKSVVG